MTPKFSEATAEIASWYSLHWEYYVKGGKEYQNKIAKDRQVQELGVRYNYTGE